MKLLSLVFGPGTILAVLYGISVGLFGAHLIGLLGAPSIVSGVIGFFVGAFLFLDSAIILNAIVIGSGVAGFFGLITRRGVIFAAVITVISYLFTAGILSWARVTGVEYGFIIVVWNLVVLVVALAVGSGVSLVARVMEHLLRK